MTDRRDLDECLELLYHLRERHDLDVASLAAHGHDFDDGALEELSRRRLVTLSGERIRLTDGGFAEAAQIIRRHRLAERLLADVLHMSPEEVERAACEYEHMVAEEITDSICILLGHPRTCPHGSPIPRGPCCDESVGECRSAAVPLPEAPIGRWVRIAYLASEGDARQHELSQFGIVPGDRIKLHQVRPSVVVFLESSQLAMEESVARGIFVWQKWHPKPPEPPARRFRLWPLRWRR